MGPIIRISKPKKPEAGEGNEPKLKKIKLKAGGSSSNNTNAKPSPKIRIKLEKREDQSDKDAKSNNSSTSKGSSRPMKLKINLKKRDDAHSQQASHSQSHQQQRKTTNVVKTPKFRIKPVRVPGEGYDSEASDIEDDPLIEEGIILRVLPDLSAEFVKNSIESGDYSGVSIKWKGERHAVVKVNGVQYGAVLVNLPSITEVNKSVDRKNLLKTFDVSQMLICVQTVSKEEEVFSLKVSDTEDLTKKHFDEYKDEIAEQRKEQLRGHNGGPLTDAESKNIDQIINKGYDYKHGITPPLYNARNRRFRNKMGPTAFDYVERTVEKLLKLDAEAEEFDYELVNEDAIQQQRSTSAADLAHYQKADEPSDDKPSAAYGAETKPIHGVAEEDEEEDHEEDLELELEQALQVETMPGAGRGSAIPAVAGTGVTANANGATRQGQLPLLEETGDDVEQDNGDDDEEEDEDEDEDEEEEEEGEEGDEEADDGGSSRSTATATTKSRVGGVGGINEEEQHRELLLDELRELQSTLEMNRAKASRTTNPLLKTRFLESIKKLEKEAELKRKQLGGEPVGSGDANNLPNGPEDVSDPESGTLFNQSGTGSNGTTSIAAEPSSGSKSIGSASHLRTSAGNGEAVGGIEKAGSRGGPGAEYDDDDEDDEEEEEEEQEDEQELGQDPDPKVAQGQEAIQGAEELDQEDMDMMLLFGADND